MIVDLGGVGRTMSCDQLARARTSKHQQRSHVLSAGRGPGNRVPMSTTPSRFRHLTFSWATAGTATAETSWVACVEAVESRLRDSTGGRWQRTSASTWLLLTLTASGVYSSTAVKVGCTKTKPNTQPEDGTARGSKRLRSEGTRTWGCICGMTRGRRRRAVT